MRDELWRTHEDGSWVMLGNRLKKRARRVVSWAVNGQRIGLHVRAGEDPAQLARRLARKIRRAARPPRVVVADGEGVFVAPLSAVEYWLDRRKLHPPSAYGLPKREEIRWLLRHTPEVKTIEDAIECLCPHRGFKDLHPWRS